VLCESGERRSKPVGGLGVDAPVLKSIAVSRGISGRLEGRSRRDGTDFERAVGLRTLVACS
jgi:hypothetical protein